MKTLKLFTVISLALIVLGINAVYAKSNSTQSNPPPTGYIKYQVNIHVNSNINWPLTRIYVVMTDENGREVAPPELFTPGTWVYVFNEAGPVTGIREARMVLPTEGGQIFHKYPSPDIKKGTFLDGNVYQFNLYPAPIKLD